LAEKQRQKPEYRTIADVVSSRLLTALLHHLMGDAEADEALLKDFCKVFGVNRSVVRAGLSHMGLILQPHLTVH